MDEETPPRGKFQRGIELTWHIISALVLVGTILTATSIGYANISVMQDRLNRVVLDQKDTENIQRQFMAESRQALDRISTQISQLREDLAKKH